MQDFLESNEISILFATMIGMFILVSLTEAVLPRRREAVNLRYRWGNNIALTIVNQQITNWIVAFVALGVIWWREQNYQGIFEYVDLGFWQSVIIAILVFEFVGYLFHRAFHAVPWLWRIHAVHHSDTELDCSSTYRSHPLELLVVVPVTVPLVLLLGFPVAAVIIYQALRTAITIFAHSNIYVPERVDRVLRLFIVTPDFHRLHHSTDRSYTDSNFCAAFPMYDYLFGTSTRQDFDFHETMEIGLERFREPEYSRIDNMLLLPFRWDQRHQSGGTASGGRLN